MVIWLSCLWRCHFVGGQDESVLESKIRVPNAALFGRGQTTCYDHHKGLIPLYALDGIILV